MKRWLAWLLGVLVCLILAAGGLWWWSAAETAGPGPAMAPTTVVIAKGTPSPEIGRLLKEAGVVDKPWLFLVEMRLSGHQPLKAGEYNFPTHASLASVLDMMRRGQTVVHKFTIAEGLTVHQVLAQLRQAESMVGGAVQPPEEGSLMPQTYFYSFGDSREALVTRMARAMNEVIDESWPHRAPNLPVANKMEAIILASIVERETAIAEERPHIAAVFLNRLKLHMKLQSDPTVIYAVSNGEGVLERPLTHDDLTLKSPFNTYVIDGLPAGAICNPGRASLLAVLHPMASDDLYFVADGSGGHVFAKTLNEHTRNVAKWRHLEKGETDATADKKAKDAH